MYSVKIILRVISPSRGRNMWIITSLFAQQHDDIIALNVIKLYWVHALFLVKCNYAACAAAMSCGTFKYISYRRAQVLHIIALGFCFKHDRNLSEIFKMKWQTIQVEACRIFHCAVKPEQNYEKFSCKACLLELVGQSLPPVNNIHIFKIIRKY